MSLPVTLDKRWFLKSPEIITMEKSQSTDFRLARPRYDGFVHKKLIGDLKRLADPVKATFFPRFFKTGPGEYAEGDTFIGVTVPQTRIIVKSYRDMPLSDVKVLLKNPIHECRLAALLILVDQYKRGDKKQKKKIVDMYMNNAKFINNWDLVDGSADKILGSWLDEIDDASLLNELASSDHLWKQRIAMIATFHFIRKKQFSHTLRVAKILINHPHDLIHKAVGWMLREVGKRDRGAEEQFLKKHYKTMPRTMLRYAIESFEEPKRMAYLKGKM